MAKSECSHFRNGQRSPIDQRVLHGAWGGGGGVNLSWERKRRRSVRARLALCAVAVVFFAAPADLAVAQTGPATPVNIPDANLRTLLEARLGKAAGATITRAEMARNWGTGVVRLEHADWRSLSVPPPSPPATVVRDLTGLEYLTLAYAVSLNYHRITDLSPLAGLTNTRRLWLRDNLIRDLSPLAGLTLDHLSISDNPVSDLSPLSGQVWLATFYAANTGISDLSPLAGLTRIRLLDLQGNHISDISPLTRVNDLTEVFLSGNQIEDLSPLANRNLQTLTAANNRITDLSPLRNSLAMETLDLNGNEGLEDLSVVERMTALKVLRLDGTGVRDLKPLVDNTGLGSGDQVYLRNVPNLNADAEQHVATLRGRGVQVRTSSPLRTVRTVRGVSVTPGVEELTVSWNPLTPTATFSPSGYRVYWWSAGARRTSGVPGNYHTSRAGQYNVVGLTTASYTIPNLTPGVEYKVRILPGTPWGDFSTIVAGTPYAALRVEGEGEGKAVTVTPGVESLDVSWNQVDGAADYKVQWKSGEEGYDSARQERTGGKTSYTIPDLTAGVEYTVRVIATTDDGADGPPSDEATGTPLDTIDISLKGDIKSLHVTWDLVDGAESYRVQWKSAEQEDYTDARQSPVLMAGTTSYTITDLTPATEYTVRVTATTADGQISMRGTATTGLSQVTGLNVEPGEESLDVTWNPVNGADGYKVQWKSGEQDYDPARQALVRGADTTSYTIPGLTPDIAYTVRVRATATNVSDGVWSKEETGRPSQDRDQQRRVLSMVLAGVGRTLAADAVEILSSRSGTPASRLHVTLDGHVLPLTASPDPSPSLSPNTPSPLTGEGRGEGAPAAKPGTGTWQRVTGVALGVARALGVTVDVPASLSGESRGEGSILQENRSLPSRFPAGALRRNARQSPLRLRPVSAKDLLARSAFNLPLTSTGEDGMPAWTLWGRGAASGFSGQPQNDFTMTGNLYSGYVGVDYRPKSAVLLGLAVAHSTGDVDYTLTGASQAAVDVEVTSILPYAHWQPTPSLGVWSMLGAGWGNMAVETAVSAGLRRTTDLSSWMGAVGGRQALITWRGIDVAAKTDAFLTTMKSDGRVGLAAARGRAQRVRLLMEGRTAVDLSPVSRVQPRLELGGRWDSGTAEQGLGLEMGGGLSYTQTDWGLSVDTQGRYLLAHQDGAFENWGASVNMRLDPGIGGEGAYLTVAPVWGQPGSGVAQLWGNAAAVPGGPTPARAAGWRPANVAVDVGYGLALADGRDLLTPYGGLVLGDPGAARYRLGSRWAVSTLLDLSVEGERAEQPGQAAAHRVSVRLGWQW